MDVFTMRFCKKNAWGPSANQGRLQVRFIQSESNTSQAQPIHIEYMLGAANRKSTTGQVKIAKT